MTAQPPDVEVVVIGGGPAGLSAALLLGRCRRRVLICDAGQPRNAAAQMFNGFLSRDSSSPSEFLRIGREELQRYPTVEFRSIHVTSAVRERAYFRITLEGGGTVTSRMLLLATGIVDRMPDIEGIRQFYGTSVHNCPYCDGWECSDQPLAVLGNNQDAAELAIELTQWSTDVILCTGGELHCSDKVWRQLIKAGVGFRDKKILRLEGEGKTLSGVRFIDGSWLPRFALFFSPYQHQKCGIAESLGCQFGDDDGGIQCANDTQTCIPGVYAAGNASCGVQLVIMAAAEGTRAAIAINEALSK